MQSGKLKRTSLVFVVNVIQRKDVHRKQIKMF